MMSDGDMVRFLKNAIDDKVSEGNLGYYGSFVDSINKIEHRLEYMKGQNKHIAESYLSQLYYFLE